MLTWAQFLGKVRPLKFGRAKNVLTFGAISDNFRVWSRISPEQIHVENRKSSLSTTTPPTLGEKKVGELWSTNKKSYRRKCWPTQIEFFDRLYFPLKFLHALEIWSRLACAHPGRPYVGLCPIFLVLHVTTVKHLQNICKNVLEVGTCKTRKSCTWRSPVRSIGLLA